MSLATLPSTGMNLGTFSYYTTALPFVDATKHGGWISLGGTGSLTVDSYGELITIPSNGAKQNCYLNNGEIYPSGEYRLEWSGTGTVTIFPRASLHTLTGSGTGWKTYNVSGTNASALEIYVTSMDTGDPVRDVKLLTPFASTSYTDTFRQGYKDQLSNHKVLRMMDWNATNNSTVVEWSERRTTSHVEWSGNIPYEMQIQLCNEAQSDLWVCIPHLASDDYIEQLAYLVFANLDDPLRVWVEYSNECWNFGFTQATYCDTTLKAAYGAGSGWESYGRRAAEAFAIFRAAIPRSRVVGVVAGQNVRTLVITNALLGSTVGGVQQADVIAVAPYFYLDTDALYADYLADTVDLTAVFAELSASVDDAIANAALHKAIADSNNMPLVAYEGGQHVGTSNATQRADAGFIELLGDINRDSRMGDLYDDLLTGWHGTGAATFCHYNDITKHSQYGSWGLMESYLDTSAAKYTAMQGYCSTAPDTVDNDFLPVITETTASVYERAVGTPMVDPDGRGPFDWEIVGGDDASKFQLVDNSLKVFGELDSAVPTDANSDGLYELTMTAVGWYGSDTGGFFVSVINMDNLSADWAGYDSVTPDNPLSAVTDYFYIVNANLLSSDWWLNAKSDGGDVRASKGDGTQVPCWVDPATWNYATQNGNIYVRYSGTKAATGSESIRIYSGNPAESAPAVDGDYGQYAVFTTVKEFYPQGGGNNAAANANHLTMSGSPTVGGVAGPITGSLATSYNGSTQYGEKTSASISAGGPYSMVASVYPTSVSGNLVAANVGSSAVNVVGLSRDTTNVAFYVGVAGSFSTVTNGTVAATAWQTFGGSQATTSRYAYLQGAPGTQATASRILSGLTTINVASYYGATQKFNGNLSLIGIYESTLSADWHAYWHSMLADPDQGDFYTLGGWTANATGGNSYTSPGVGLRLGLGI